MTPGADILGLGCTAVDELLYVDAYPAADAKTPVRRHQRQCGGLTATALVAAARLGARCAYAGSLGDDELSGIVLQELRSAGVDLSLVRRRPDARPIHSYVIVDQCRQTRAILFDLHAAVGAEPDWPPEEAIRAIRVLFVDHFGAEGMIRAAEIARQAGAAVVADLESAEHPQFSRLMGLVDHLILSLDFVAQLTGAADPAAAVRALSSPGRKLTAVTCGARGYWYATDGEPRHEPAFPVRAVDTTGCGDVFHGAYAAALVRGLSIPDSLRFAAAAAALKATRPGGQAGIPSLPEVEALLRGSP